MKSDNIKRIIRESIKIKRQDEVLISSLYKTIQENFDGIFKHYDNNVISKIITETVQNRTSDSSQRLIREFLHNLKNNGSHEIVDEGWKQKFSAGALAASMAFGTSASEDNNSPARDTTDKVTSTQSDSQEFRQEGWSLFKNRQDRIEKLKKAEQEEKAEKTDEGIGSMINRSIKNIKRANDGWGKVDDEIYGGYGKPKSIVRRNKNHDDETLDQLQKLTLNAKKGTPAGLRKKVIDREINKRKLNNSDVNESLASFGRATGNLLVGKDLTAGVRKLAGMATGSAIGSMSRADIVARDDYIKDFTSKISAAIDSGVRSGTLIKAPTSVPVRESISNKPKIKSYIKTYADGQTSKRYEVLDYKGARAPGQGSEGFDDLINAKKFLAKNKLDLSDPLYEAVANSQTISSYVVSTVEYYAKQAGILSIDQFKPTIDSLAQQIEQTYPKNAKQLIQKLADVVYSLTSSTMQQGKTDDDLTQRTEQVMNMINSMNKQDDIDDIAYIAKAALQKLYRGDQAMMSRMFNAVEVKAQERMGK